MEEKMNIKEFDLKNYFDIKRFVNLCRIEVFNNWKLFVLVNGIIAVVYLNFEILSFLMRNHQDPYSYFSISLFIGIIITSFCYKSVHNKEKATGYFMTPVSAEEKFIVKFFLTSFVYFILAIITFVIASSLSGLLYLIAAKVNFSVFNPFNYNMISTFGSYMIFHSIFFFGSIFFKKNNFVKTSLAIFILFFVLLFTLLLLSITILSSLAINNLGNDMNKIADFINNSKSFIGLTIKIFLCYLIPVVLYLLTYFRLKKTEVK
jgi:hypothetical protein